MVRRLAYSALVASVDVIWACSASRIAGPARGQGQLAMALTDAPTPFDSIREVNVFVQRIDARRAQSDSAEANTDIENERDEDHDRPDSTLWVTIAKPNKSFDLLALQNGVTAFLGSTVVDTGSFKGIRLVIDPAKSTVVLKDGTVLSTTSKPPIEFETRERRGLLVELNEKVEVKEGQTSTITIDFRLGDSMSLIGRTIRDGFFFRPVIKGSRKND